MRYFRQCGENKKYPETIEAYRRGAGEIVPQWLSDKAKIVGFDENDNPMLAFTSTSTGGYEIKAADGIKTLVVVKEKSGYICYSKESGIFSLTEKQLGLLYRPE